MAQSSDKLTKTILSNIRHDLINPVNAIIGYSELLLDIISGDVEQIRSDIDSIHVSAQSILSDIKNIFSKERLEGGDVDSIICNADLQHLLRTPLTTIIGLTEFLIDEKLYKTSSECEDIEDSLISIGRGGKALLGQINDLKAHANLTFDELIAKYDIDMNSDDGSIRTFDFQAQHKVLSQIGNILVVDDESANIDLLEKILKQSNHTVHRALNGSDALDILSKESISVDLILLDLIMPGMNGMELLQKLKADKNTLHIPIIMLSALDEIDTIIDCINLGADDFLLKPINRVFLNARLNNALEKKHFRDREREYQNKIKIEQDKSEALLLNILPRKIAERLKNGETLIADDISSATVLFADLTGFTTFSSDRNAKDLVLLLNKIFSVFDELLVKHSLEKIKTIGDNYMLAGGIPDPIDNHAHSVAEMALDMIGSLPKINKETNNSLQIRIGINSGPVSAGVIGKKKFIYDLWGDTVNVASRMESYGENGHIHVTENTQHILADAYNFEKRPMLNVSGKGSMQTYFLTGRK